MTLFINDTATTEIYTLSLHDALPIFPRTRALAPLEVAVRGAGATPPRRDPVPVHADAHRAARLAPLEIGTAHVCTPVTPITRMPSSACKEKNELVDK